MNQKYSFGIIIFAGLLMVIWGASLAGWFRLPELMLYDGFVRTTPARQLATEKILLVEAGPEAAFTGDDTWLDLNRRLQAAGAGQIVYTFVPRNVSRDFFKHAGSVERICFGRRLEPATENKAQLRPETLPKAAEGLDIDFGVSTISEPDYGIYRFHSTHVRVGEERSPTLVHVAAEQRLGQPAVASDPFFVNFNGKASQLASISLDKALSGQLVPELVENKSVLVGYTDPADPPGLQTPISRNDHGINRLTYQGLALDTLLSDKTIYDTNLWIDLLCMAVVAAIGLIAYQVMNFAFALWFTGISLALYLLISWIVFSFLLIWPPVFEIILTQGLVFGVIVRRRQMLDQTVLETVLSRISNRIKAYIIPEDFIASRRHWHHIVSMVSQTLNLSRSIFLEKVEKDHRVKEIATANCALEDIRERRRDFERTPYTTALSENGPIQVENYLSDIETEEIQYLVPLYFAGQVMGFWAFGIHPEEYRAFNDFENTVYNYSHQISEMLYQRQRWQEEQRIENRPFVRFLQLKAGKSLPRSVHESYAFVEKKLLLFESVLDSLKTAVIVYDLLGHVIEINPEMEQILSEMEVKPFESSAAELAAGLCRTEAGELRRHLNQVVTEGDSVTMPVITSAEMEKDYILTIRPVQMGQNGPAGNEDTQSQPLRSILMELVEITEFKDVCTLKDDLLEDFHDRQRQAIETMATYMSRMEKADIDWEEIKQGFPGLKESVNHLMEAKDTINTYISRNLYTSTHLEFPILPMKHLNQALQRLKNRANESRIAFDVRSPEKQSPVFAEPRTLQKVFYAIIAVLLDDAAENTTIIIEIDFDASDGFLQFHFRNQGFGMPEETFQHYLASGRAKASENFVQLKNMMTEIQQWNAMLCGSSDVGRGIDFTLKLKTLN